MTFKVLPNASEREQEAKPHYPKVVGLQGDDVSLRPDEDYSLHPISVAPGLEHSGLWECLYLLPRGA